MINKIIEKKINKIYESVFKKVYAKNKSAIQKGNVKNLTNDLLRLGESKEYDTFAKKFAIELSKKSLLKNKGIWRQFFNAARNRHVIGLPQTYNEYELNIMKKAVIHNFKMIKTIPKNIIDTYSEKLVQTLISQIATGDIGRGSFEKELKKIGSKHAKIIARTETAKLQTHIVENRATALGSVAYIWKSSNDIRTRKSHKEMNNVVVFWRNENEKPLRDNMRGDAGEFPNCRCSPQPIFDENDINNSSYKVYDYRYDKIIHISALELLSSIKNKQL